MIGYPEWWGERIGGRGWHQGGATLGRGQNRGVRANVVHTNGKTSAVLPGLSTKQWQTLMGLLNNHKGNVTDKVTSKHNTWIIDT